MGCKVITLPMRKNVSDQGAIWQVKAAGRRVGKSAARKPADESNKRVSALTTTKVREVLAQELGVAKSRITNKALIVDDLSADYTDKCRILWRLQLEFDVDMPVEDVNVLHTVQDLTAYFFFKILEKGASFDSAASGWDCNDIGASQVDVTTRRTVVDLFKTSVTQTLDIYSSAIAKEMKAVGQAVNRNGDQREDWYM
jgi:acyl carrier protein